MKAIRQTRHPLAMRNTREIPTGVLINKAMETYTIEQLETVEADLKDGIAKRILPPWAESALEKVTQTLAKRRLEAAFKPTKPAINAHSLMAA